MPTTESAGTHTTPVQATLAVWIDSLAAQQIEHACRGSLRLLRVRSRPAFDGYAAAASIDVLAVRLDRHNHEERLADLCDIRERHASMGIIVLAEPVSHVLETCIALTHIGIQDIIPTLALNNTAGYAGIVDRAMAQSVTSRALSGIGADCPAEIRTLLTTCLRMARQPLDVTTLAARLGTSRRTLAYWTARHGYAHPRVCIAMSRLLHAAFELEFSKGSAEHVAERLGFPSGVALRHLFRRHMGTGLYDARRSGVIARTLYAFSSIVRGDTPCASTPKPMTGSCQSQLASTPDGAA